MHSHTRWMLAAVAIAAAPLAAQAHSSYLSAFDTRYGTANTRLDTCSTCHGSTTSTWNPYGNDVKANIAAGIDAALAAVEPLDSDGDKFSNLDEIHALTFPGDPKDYPTTTSAPKIGLTPTSLSFGTVNVGATASQTSTISNSGTANLSINSIVLCAGTSGEYTFSPTVFPVTVAPGGSAKLTVNYTPVDSSTDTGCIAVSSNDTTNNPANVSVTGMGVQPSDYSISSFYAPAAARVRSTISLSVSYALVTTTSDLGARLRVTAVLPTGATQTVADQIIYGSGTLTFPYKVTKVGTYNWTAEIIDPTPDTAAASTTVTRK